MLFKFAQPWWLISAGVLTTATIVVRYFFYKPTLYRYPLLHFIVKKNGQAFSFWPHFFYGLYVSLFILLIILLGKPQFVDQKSKINVDGVDIMLLMDMSGSMACTDDLNDLRSRLTVAKKEALGFVDQRTNDAIGLVLFGNYALVRCPLTLDKQILKSIISDLEIGQPSADMQSATMLSQGLMTALRRLQSSKAKSKIIILLTDGAPSPGDLDPADAVKIAQELNVKIYTIGVGSRNGGYIQDPIFGWRQVQSPINLDLLEFIAQKTGGKFFMAQHPDELKKIYAIIDALEKQQYETEVYAQYHDYFKPFLYGAMVIVFFYLFASTWLCFIL